MFLYLNWPQWVVLYSRTFYLFAVRKTFFSNLLHIDHKSMIITKLLEFDWGINEIFCFLSSPLFMYLFTGQSCPHRNGHAYPYPISPHNMRPNEANWWNFLLLSAERQSACFFSGFLLYDVLIRYAGHIYGETKKKKKD